MGFRGAFANIGWTSDNDVDLGYHVRRSALPRPGRVRELLELTSRLHANLLDRHRPLWETHVIEGLNDGRFAIYTKIHHALVDGVSGMTLMRESMDADPIDGEFRAPWSPAESGRLVAGAAACKASAAWWGPLPGWPRRRCGWRAPRCWNNS